MDLEIEKLRQRTVPGSQVVGLTQYLVDDIKKQDPPKQKDKAEDIISTFIVNQLGINLVAVKDIQVDRQPDGQIKQIKIDFIPDNKV